MPFVTLLNGLKLVIAEFCCTDTVVVVPATAVIGSGGGAGGGSELFAFQPPIMLTFPDIVNAIILCFSYAVYVLDVV
jgi:hypothetical protein